MVERIGRECRVCLALETRGVRTGVGGRHQVDIWSPGAVVWGDRDKRSHLKQKLSGIAHTLLSISRVLKLMDELSTLL